MVVAVDEGGQQDLLAGADDFGVRVAAVQVVEGAELEDDAVFLQDGAAGDRFDVVFAGPRREGGPAADQGGWQWPAPRLRPLPCPPPGVRARGRAATMLLSSGARRCACLGVLRLEGAPAWLGRQSRGGGWALLAAVEWVGRSGGGFGVGRVGGRAEELVGQLARIEGDAELFADVGEEFAEGGLAVGVVGEFEFDGFVDLAT